MGVCASHTQIAPTPTAEDPNDVEILISTAIRNYRALSELVQSARPYYITKEFIHTMDELRANITGLLNRMEIEQPHHLKYYTSLYQTVNHELQRYIRERFRDGRIRITAEVIHIPSVVELLLSHTRSNSGGGQSCSALY